LTKRYAETLRALYKKCQEYVLGLSLKDYENGKKMAVITLNELDQKLKDDKLLVEKKKSDMNDEAESVEPSNEYLVAQKNTINIYKKLFKVSGNDIRELLEQPCTGFHHDFFHLWPSVQAVLDKSDGKIWDGKMELAWEMYGELGRELIVRMTEHEANLLAVVQAANKMQECSPAVLEQFLKAVKERHDELRVVTMTWVVGNLAVL
jgi:hypothetical protein